MKRIGLNKRHRLVIAQLKQRFFELLDFLEGQHHDVGLRGDGDAAILAGDVAELVVPSQQGWHSRTSLRKTILRDDFSILVDAK